MLLGHEAQFAVDERAGCQHVELDDELVVAAGGHGHALGLADTLIRLSPGIESSRDLITDLIEGLDALGTTAAVEPELVAAK